MIFSSLVFLFAFLPLVLITYYLLPFRPYRNFILFCFSVLFYSWGEPVYVIIMIDEILINYLMAILIHRVHGKKTKKLLMFLTVIIDLSIIGFFKYSNFFVSILNDTLNLGIEFLSIALPIGISFYTFQVLSYVVDVYRGVVAVQKNPLYLATYVVMFPQLIAGPIVRYETIEEEIVHRKESFSDFANGVRRLITGLGKKVIIANNIAMISDKIFLEFELSSYTPFIAWVAAVCYALQIYYDFSGYSDMAIGLGQMFGFHFLENFNYPYIANSITDFWRRWHISLSTWFRDYVYIPLGGNRCGKLRWLMNVMIVWGLTGLWHGADYNFLYWGLYFGLILVVEKVILLKVLKMIPVLRNFYTIVIVLFGWVIFNSSSSEQIAVFATNMFTKLPSFDFSLFVDNGWVSLLPYIFLGLIGCFPFVNKLLNAMNKNVFTGMIVDAYYLLVLAFCIVLLINNTYNPFIYFRF